MAIISVTLNFLDVVLTPPKNLATTSAFYNLTNFESILKAAAANSSVESPVLSKDNTL
jgi:hypothetical protein